MEIRRWRRYGKDRLYVTDDDGADLGWWDLVADAPHPSSDTSLTRLTAAVSLWRASCAEPVPANPPTAEAAPAEPNTTEVIGVETPRPRATIEATSPEPIAPEHEIPAALDLLSNSPGQQLAQEIAAAHAAGKRPTLLRRFFLGKNAYSTWERGAIGERLVAEELSKLVRKDPRWGFINSIPVGSNGSDIDHLVIGPGGVFSINTKYHRGCKIWVGGDTIMINGARQPYVRNSRHEAERVGRLLTAASGIDVLATGLVVPVAASDFAVKQQPDDVRVVNRGRLVRFLRQTVDVLDTGTIATLFEYARLGSTWTVPPR